MISDLCDRGACETCFEDELDACGHECHDPLDCPAGEARLTTEYTGTGRAADPAAERAPVARRVARATVPGEAAVLVPPGAAAGKTSPQPGERQAAGRPGPGAGETDPASGNRMPASPGRGRTQAPAPVSRAAHLDRAAAMARVPDKMPTGGALDADSALSAGQGRTFTIALPAGMKLLSLNDRGHWAARYRRSQALKEAAWAMAKQAKIPHLERVSVTAEYQPPDRRRRDADNPVASVKAAIDGIVLAGCLPGDDSPRYVESVTCTIGETYPRGRLVLHLTELVAVAGRPGESPSRSGRPVRPHRSGGAGAA